MRGFYTAKVGKYPGLRLPESGFHRKRGPQRQIKPLFTAFATKQIPTKLTTYPGERPTTCRNWPNRRPAILRLIQGFGYKIEKE
jgi:hypothetical protein